MLRTPALLVALIAAVLIVLVETGSSFGAFVSIFDGLAGRVSELGESFSGLQGSQEQEDSDSGGVGSFTDLEDLLSADSEDLPGMAVAALIFIDILLMVTVLLFNLPLIFSPRILAMLQGIISLILGIVVILFSLLTILKALVQLFVMIGLLLAIPFGTIAYMTLYADFETGQAAAILGLLMLLKCVLAISLLIASPRFLINLGFVAQVATSFVVMIIISFLHNFPPTFLVAITDVVAALIVCIVAIIWGIIYVIGGIIGILTMLKGLAASAV